MAKIGNYVHLNYKNYLKYSLNTPESGKEETPNIQKIFNQQTEAIYKNSKSKKENIKVQELEDLLNFYFNPNKNTKLTPEEENIKKYSPYLIDAVRESLGKAGHKIKVTQELAAEAISGNYDKILKQADYNFIKYYKKELNERDQVYKSSMTRLINELLGLRKKIVSNQTKEAKKLLEKLNKLDEEWTRIKTENKGKWIQVKNSENNKTFFDELNNLLGELSLANVTQAGGMIGELGVVGITALANIQTGKEVNNIVQYLEEEMSKHVKGQDRSKKGLSVENFDIEHYVDLNQVVSGTSYIKDEKTGNYFTTKFTQDKVDIEVEFGGEKILGSVKNYNLANTKFEDIHLLSGRSVLALVQEYGDFVNHFLNIAAEHEDNEGAEHGDFLDKAIIIMKLTILLKALQGAVYAKDRNGQAGNTAAVDVFIVNDISVGKYKVYSINEILNAIKDNIKFLKTGDFDEMSRLSNDPVDLNEGLNMAGARVRISNLLAQLHSMSLEVSIDRQVFAEVKRI